MPIYGYKTVGLSTWEIEKEITEYDRMQLAKLLIHAKDEFEYKHEDMFNSSIKVVKNPKESGFYIAKFDGNKSCSDISSYYNKIESLLNYCNDKLIKNKKYKKYKFDFISDTAWSMTGEIVIMKKK